MKTIFITGSTDGIGKQTAFELAKLGHKIFLHGRDLGKIYSVRDEIKYQTGNENINFFISDFASFKSVREMCDEIISENIKFDVLINNAGVYITEKNITEDGNEFTFQIKHLSTILLTNLLLQNITDGGRIVNLSSIAHVRGKIDFNNLNSESFFDGYFAYSLSKLSNSMFTFSLAEKLKERNITVNCLHPGVINTKLLHKGFDVQGDNLIEGCKTSIYAAL